MHRRKRDPLASTEFSYSRFLTPFLAGYTNEPALFLDADMLVMGDIKELFDLYDPEYAVQVVKHSYVPRDQEKFLGNTQTTYQCKNWSSLMLMNPARCWQLTAEYVDQASGLDLHQFKWLDGEFEIGELPKGWNYLVGEENQCPIDEVKIAHFTRGGPWLKEYDGCEFSRTWHLERDDMLRADQKEVVAA